MTNTRKARKVRCIETGEVYNSYTEAGKAIGSDSSCISRVISGKLKSAKGFHFEVVEENAQGGTGLTLTVANEQGEPIPVIDSREVARMMGKDHKHVLEYIEGNESVGVTSIAKVLLRQEVSVSDYFIESSYLSSNNRKARCYLVTKKGCELLCNKQQGEKGILFSLAYVERFNAMEKELKSKSENQHPSLAREDELILTVVKGDTPIDRATALQEYTALITDKATAPLKEELKQVTTELNDKTEFIDDINDCFTFTKVKDYNKQLLRDRKDIVLCTAKLNEVAAELNIPINKIDNPIEHSPYRRVNAYPRKVWEKAYPDIKLPEKPDIKLPEKKESK